MFYPCPALRRPALLLLRRRGLAHLLLERGELVVDTAALGATTSCRCLPEPVRFRERCRPAAASRSPPWRLRRSSSSSIELRGGALRGGGASAREPDENRTTTGTSADVAERLDRRARDPSARTRASRARRAASACARARHRPCARAASPRRSRRARRRPSPSSTRSVAASRDCAIALDSSVTRLRDLGAEALELGLVGKIGDGIGKATATAAEILELARHRGRARRRHSRRRCAMDAIARRGLGGVAALVDHAALVARDGGDDVGDIDRRRRRSRRAARRRSRLERARQHEQALRRDRAAGALRGPRRGARRSGPRRRSARRACRRRA